MQAQALRAGYNVPTYQVKMDSFINKIKNGLMQVAKVPYWIFLTAFIISSLVCISALRHNNQAMVKLRSAVYEADKNNGDVNTALNSLRRYVYGHMNTDLSSGNNAIKPPIQLKYTYDRLTSASQAASNNAGLYTEAEDYCQTQIPASVSISGRGRIDCVQSYILSHGGNAAKVVPTALYQYDFVSPSWSPDLAGWSLVISVILLLATLTSFVIDRLLKSHLSSI
jgi:hypothetical protein